MDVKLLCFFVLFIIKGSLSMVLRLKTPEPGLKCGMIAPGLQGAFGFHCVVPVGTSNSNELNVEPAMDWTANGKPISNSGKHMMGMRQYNSYYNGKMQPVYDMFLVINSVDDKDVGVYSLKIEMPNKSMAQSMMLPAAIACGNHPMCYEDQCEWPAKLSCKSTPEAYCQMDMCNENNLCMPRWFVGAKEINCTEVEETLYHDN